MGMWVLELMVLRVCMAALVLGRGMWKILEFKDALNLVVLNTWFK